MKWSYKTVHFELKKEGLLGSGFLDESEIEQELNEFGLAGWELVSVLEVQDGIIVFFKQSIYRESLEAGQHLRDTIPEKEKAEHIEQVDDPAVEETVIESVDEPAAEDVVAEPSAEPETDDHQSPSQDPDAEVPLDDESIIGAIKIE